MKLTNTTDARNNGSNTPAKSWGQAYLSFLLSPNENLVLKIAPALLIVGSPELLASNLIPVVGEVADIGGLTLATLVAFRTLTAVRKYR